MSWSPIQPSDDLAQRADKLERNLDALRANVEQLREQDLRHVEEVTGLLARRITGLDQAIATRDAASRQAATAAMRWEVGGLLITLVGAGLSIFG